MHSQHDRQKFEHIMRQLESLNPSLRLHKKEIGKQFCKLTHTPDHPPYASMIQQAILELNDQGGSSEEAISKFIEAEYDDLPIAHASYLSHHLQKLITKGEIVCISPNCYFLPYENFDSVHLLKKGQKRLRKFRQGRLKGRQRTVNGIQSQQNQRIEEGQESNQVWEKISEGAEEQKQAEEQRMGLIGENKELGDAVLVEEHNEVEEVQYKMIEELIEDELYKQSDEYHVMPEQQNRQQMELNVQENQVPWQSVEWIAEEQNQEEEGHHARKNDEATEIELHEVQEDVVTEEPCHREQTSEKPEESNQIQDPESEVRKQEVQLADIQIETMAEQISSQEQCEVLYQAIEGTAEKHNQEEESHQGRKNGEVTTTVFQEVPEDVVIEEPLLKEQKSKTPVESNQIQDQESEAREEQVQVAELPIETMVEQINLQGQCSELSYEGKKLQEQQVEVCCQIIDLSNTLVQFVKKEKEDEATVSTQNDTANQKDLFGSSLLTKEEFMELLKKAHNIGGKLIEIINMDVLEHNHSKPTTGMQQKKLLENHLQKTNEPCLKGSESVLVHESQPQQHEICGQLEVSESQPETILASDSVPTSLMEFEQNCQIELPMYKRPPEVEVTILEGLNREHNKQVKLCGQQEAFISQSKSMTVSLDLSLNSLHDKNENSQGVVERTGMILEENRDSSTVEPNINLIGEAAISRPETETSVDVQFMDSGKLWNSNNRGLEKLSESQLVISSHNVAMELQAVDLEKQTQLQKTKTPPAEIKSSTTDKTISTSIAKQCGQKKKMPDQHQLRKLRPRGPMASNHEPVITTVEVDNDYTLASLKAKLKQNSMQNSQTADISQSTEKEPLNLERQQKRKHKAMVKISQPTEQQVNHHRQRKRLKSQPTTITTVDSFTSQQQTQEQLKQRNLWPQNQLPSQSESVVVKSMEEPLSLRNQQSGQVKLQFKRRGRPPKAKPDVDPSMRELSVLDHQHHVQKPSPCRTRGRPSKMKTNADASMKGSLFSDHQNHMEPQQKHAQGRPSTKKTNAVASMKGSPFSDHQNHEEQRPKGTRGRPPKSKLRNVDLTSPPMS